MSAHHHHHHGSGHALPSYGRAFAIGIGLNSLFIIAEIIYGIKANALMLLADAGHNASDVLGLCMAWGAAVLAKSRPSGRFTYGLQSASIFAALANALILLVSVGGIGWSAIHRLAAPEMPTADIIMGIAAMGIAVNGFTAWLFHAGSNDLNIRAAFIHMAGDTAISLGVLVSGFLMTQTGWLWLDPVISLIVAVFIVASTWGLLKDSIAMALQAVPPAIDLAEVKVFLEVLPGVQEVHDLHIWAMSTTGVALSAHLLMPGGHPGDMFIHKITHTLQDRFHINHATIQIEIGDSGPQCHFDCGHAAEPVA